MVPATNGARAVNDEAFLAYNRDFNLTSTGLHLSGETEKAKPDFDFQWQASSAGTLNYNGDFYSFIRSGQVSIHRKNPSKLTYDKIHSSDGSRLQTDDLIYCAGWRWTSPIHFVGMSSLELGIPTTIDDLNDIQDWKSKCKDADIRLLAMFRSLRSAPPGPQRSITNEFGANEEGTPYTPCCLHRAIAPPSQAGEKSPQILAFLGMFSTLPTAALCEIQALWAIAYLHGQIKLPQTTKSAKTEATLWTRWSRLRYPFSQPSKFIDTAFDIVPYFDVLLSDLQLKCRRKKNWWREPLEPYGAADYRGFGE